MPKKLRPGVCVLMHPLHHVTDCVVVTVIREEVLVASIDLEHKRKEVEVQLRLNREQALERKDQEEVLREKLGSSAQEANRIQEDREKKLREQRDRIVAQKKKEREMKVKREQELEQEMREGSSTADKVHPATAIHSLPILFIHLYYMHHSLCPFHFVCFCCTCCICSRQRKRKLECLRLLERKLLKKPKVCEDECEC